MTVSSRSGGSAFLQGENDMDNAMDADFMETLKKRFAANMKRHPGVDWKAVEAKVKANPKKLKILREMESSGGEPDVIGREDGGRAFIFCDCSPEAPLGRRGLCYDRQALDSRKENKPRGSAVEMAAAIGCDMLDEEQYRELQRSGEYDIKTSSWVKTPGAIRKLGGALFCDRRYDRVFVYHNGAESYYSARGFRGLIKV
jgi:hypothetical protein